jgi:hypothetical protein
MISSSKRAANPSVMRVVILMLANMPGSPDWFFAGQRLESPQTERLDIKHRKQNIYFQ